MGEVGAGRGEGHEEADAGVAVEGAEVADCGLGGEG